MSEGKDDDSNGLSDQLRHQLSLSSDESAPPELQEVKTGEGAAADHDDDDNKHTDAHAADDEEEEDDDDDDDADAELSDVETSVDLGFASPPSHPLRLSRAYFPSKVGGRPAWLNAEHPPSASALRCSACSSPLSFLLQLYCPVRSSPALFHRTLFLFICRRQQCLLQHSAAHPAIQCWRSQLPLQNAHYPATPPPKLGKRKWKEGDEPVEEELAAGVHLCAVCGLRGGSVCSSCQSVWYCGKRCQKQDWKLGHKADCRGGGRGEGGGGARDTADASVPAAAAAPTASSSPPPATPAPRPSPPSSSSQLRLARSRSLFPAYSLSIETEYIPHTQADDFTKERALLTAYQQEQAAAAAAAAADDDDDDDGLSSLGRLHHRDACFTRFRHRLSHHPEQVLRYERGGQPLWVSSQHQLAAADMPRCERCGGRRRFECQILPQLLYYCNRQSATEAEAAAAAAAGAQQQEQERVQQAMRAWRDSLDFGSLFVYTCDDSCGDGEKEYMREFVYVQHHSGEVRERGNDESE